MAVPHEGHAAPSGLPHCMQKRADDAFSVPQARQAITARL
jgi:hypothetical protein